MVETRLVARVLGVRLLRVDGVVLVSPARLVEPPGGRHAATTRAAGADLARAAQLLAECRDRPPAEST